MAMVMDMYTITDTDTVTDMNIDMDTVTDIGIDIGISQMSVLVRHLTVITNFRVITNFHRFQHLEIRVINQRFSKNYHSYVSMKIHDFLLIFSQPEN
jgi:hypothetical protein